MSREHIEYEDTERPGVPYTGYRDPHEQTGSEAEVSVLSWETHPPKPRIWGERAENEDGIRSWHLRLPSGDSYVYDSYGEAFGALAVLSFVGGSVASDGEAA